MILGIDEVGRGPWAGPLVIGAVVLGDARIEGLDDSKKLTAKKRTALAERVKSEAAGWGLGWVEASEIDTVGLSAALRLATIRAVEAVKVPYHEIIIDGTINFLSETTKGRYVTVLPKADGLIPAVSAASIIAKVARDAYMAEQDGIYLGYGFASHVGYGTAKHRDALALLGLTPLHRLSFAPIAAIAATEAKSHVHAAALKKSGPPSVTTKSIGDKGEALVEKYLLSKGHTVLERNWKNRWCEIDIVSSYDGAVYFTEVKTRSNKEHGDGFTAITAAKLKRMTFAVEMYVHAYKLDTTAVLAAASVDGNGTVQFLELV